MRSVSIIGVGETKIGRFPDRTFRDLIGEAGNKALGDAGLSPDKIEALYFGNFNGQQLCSQGHMGALVSEVLGLGSVPTVRVEGACASGSLALRQAYIAVAAGLYDVVLVGGAEKMTHRKTEDVTEAIASASDIDLEAGIGLTFPAIFALIANRYAKEYGNPRAAMSYVAVQNHANGFKNPDAQMRKLVTVEQVENGAKIVDPFTLYDCSLVSDGSVFAVVAATDTAKRLGIKKPIEIIGMGHAGSTLTAASKDSLTSFSATVNAAKQAYTMAGISPRDVDFAEVHDCFTITQIINCEDLGFFEKGKAPEGILEGKTSIDSGFVAINPSGGLKSKGHPIGATGLSQVFEAVTQLRHDAGERQVPGAKIGLCHNIGGTAATCVVTILKEAH